MDNRLLYTTPFLFAGLAIFLVSVFTWKRRYNRGGWYLFFSCLSASVWSITEGLLYWGFDTETNMMVTRFQYVGIVGISSFMLLFILAQYGLEAWITNKSKVLLFSLAAVILILVWTNSYHNLYYTDYYTINTADFPMLGLVHGPLWWGFIGYNYILLFTISIVLIYQAHRSVSLYRGQALVFLISVCSVWAANLIYVTGNSPLPNMDVSPLAFTLMAASLAYGFFYYNLLDILPVAKNEIFNSLDEPILVMDKNDRIVDMNRASESLFGLNIQKVLGRGIGEHFLNQPQFLEGLKKSEAAEVVISNNDREQIYDLRIYSLKDRKQVVIGRLAVLRDITERKWMEQELRRLAVTDPLTGAANRRHLFELADTEFIKATRYQRQFSVILIDIDHFKKINDTHGHDTGDEVLKLLVGVCLKKLRGVDIFGRVGGEEFVAVLTDTTADKAVIVAERLRSEIAGMDFIKEGKRINFTISMGLAKFEAGDSDFREILKRADLALYRAKNEGRNCVR